MGEYAATKRIILDGPPSDFDKLLSLARDAIQKGDEGEIWGYWSSGDPDFQAVIRVNKASVSVKAVRKEPTP